MTDLKQDEENGGGEKDDEVLKTRQTFLSYARMATEFGTIQVKLLTEKGCDDNINGWYRVSEFRPDQNDELAEKCKTWNYAMRLVPVKRPTERDGPNSSKGDHECEIIVLRKTERGHLGFELPRSGVVHISEAIEEGDDDEKILEESVPFRRRSRLVRISEGLKSSEGDLRWSSGQQERSGSYLNILMRAGTRNSHSSRDSRILANTNLGSLSVAQPIPSSTVAVDIQSTRESYLATVQQRDNDEEDKRIYEKVHAYRQSLQRKSSIRYSQEKNNYSKIFPKTAPTKYNKSALSELETGDESDVPVTLSIPSKTSSHTSIHEKQDKPYKELFDEPSIESESSKIKHSKKFGYTKSFIDNPRESEDSNLDDKAKMKNESKIDMTNNDKTWREINWEERSERVDDESDSYIELDSSSILSVKDLRSENELEIVVYSPVSGVSAQSEVVSPSNSSPDNELMNKSSLRYVTIPKQKIQDFLTKGIGARRHSETDDGTKVKEIYVKRKP